jgi:hypothetical protein
VSTGLRCSVTEVPCGASSVPVLDLGRCSRRSTPSACPVLAGAPGGERDLVGDHERRVEPDAELSDQLWEASASFAALSFSSSRRCRTWRSCRSGRRPPDGTSRCRCRAPSASGRPRPAGSRCAGRRCPPLEAGSPASDSSRSLSRASDALEISSRRKMSLFEYSECTTRCSSWRVSAWNSKVSLAPDTPDTRRATTCRRRALRSRSYGDPGERVVALADRGAVGARLRLCGAWQPRCDPSVEVVEPEPGRHVLAHSAEDGGERQLVADASQGSAVRWAACLPATWHVRRGQPRVPGAVGEAVQCREVRPAALHPAEVHLGVLLYGQLRVPALVLLDTTSTH